MAAHFLVTDGNEFSILPPALVTALRGEPRVGAVYPRYNAFDDNGDFYVYAGYDRLLNRRYGLPAGPGPDTA
ncbi:hypothetical protein GCM10010172_67810 [Paractinoplanes ferrugineus]|uniref:Uncharacterized protein n=1 Tax=Paractinoplanes ferrugineus TaxID=113564 RepID=A0A919JG38_9ACTN|nr:hypothetical protein [Actinoplanes ferrugineus]GIE16566.1 hypothetical protein Afe05nite_84060 [Actinoplanes ferrugineus]